MFITETLILDAHASLELLRHLRCKECIGTRFQSNFKHIQYKEEQSTIVTKNGHRFECNPIIQS